MEKSTSTIASRPSVDAPVESPDEWVGRYGDLLFRAAYARVNHRSTAEDLVQEAFLAAWKGRTAFDGRSELGTWLVSILKRKIADHFRATGRSRESAAGADPNTADELFDGGGVWRSPIGKLSLDMETALEREEFRHVLESCVHDLPGNLAQAFSLRELESATPAVACDALGISRQNLAVRLHRARLLLRQCLEGRWLGERKRSQ